MRLKNTIIYLFGFPGTGKYTIAREIARQGDFVLLDNHLINNPVFSVMRPDGKTRFPPEIWENCKRVWGIVWDTIHTVAPADNSYVLTNQLTENEPGDRAWFAEIAAQAGRKNAVFLPVRLLCDEAELRRRVVNEDRRARMKMTDADRVSAYVRDDKVLEPDHPGLMTLDVTAISPQEAAMLILKRAADLGR